MHIADASLPILRRALQSRLNELSRLMASMRGALAEDSDAVRAEYEAVGKLMDGVKP